MLIKSKSDLLNVLSFKYSITISLTGIIIGCKQYANYAEYKKLSPKDGKQNGYTDYDMTYLNTIVKNAITYMKHLKKENK